MGRLLKTIGICNFIRIVLFSGPQMLGADPSCPSPLTYGLACFTS
jgi:hypothetical protein